MRYHSSLAAAPAGRSFCAVDSYESISLEIFRVFSQLQELVMKWDVDSLKRLARTGDFIPSLLLLLVNDSCCYYVLVYFFLFPLIRCIASVPVLRESLDCSLL